MHLITAALISFLANPDGLRKLKPGFIAKGRVPSFPGLLEHGHGIPGRHRLLIPSLRGSSAGADILTEKLPVIPGVESVRCDLRSGSVLVTGTEDLDGGLLVAAAARILGLDKAIDAQPQSKMTTFLRHFWQGLDQAVFHRTGGRLTATDGIGLFLLGASIVQVRRTRALGLPPAVTMLWWFYTLSSRRTDSR